MRVTEDRERSVGIKIIPECPAMSGTAWEARLFLLRYGLSRGWGGERALSAPWLSAPPLPPPLSLPPNPPSPAEPQG